MKELNTLYWLKRERKQIENQIKELTVLSAVAMSGMPSGSTVSSPAERFNERLEQLKKKLQRKCAEILTETERIEESIEKIEDAEIKVIARMRFIDNKTFQVIGDELYMARTTAYEKLKRYFEKQESEVETNIQQALNLIGEIRSKAIRGQESCENYDSTYYKLCDIENMCDKFLADFNCLRSDAE